MIRPRPRGLVCLLYVIKSRQSSTSLPTDCVLRAVIVTRLSCHHVPFSAVDCASGLLVSLSGCLLEMDLFLFIRHSDPTKVRVGERNVAEGEVKLLTLTEGRVVLLVPPASAASVGSNDSIDKLFDDGNDVGQEHPNRKKMDLCFGRGLLPKDAS
ncbi:hypothetical protein Tco_1522974 [Tanacetum coccineum]